MANSLDRRSALGMFTVRVYGDKHLLRKYAVHAQDEADAIRIGYEWAEKNGKEARRATAKAWR